MALRASIKPKKARSTITIAQLNRMIDRGLSAPPKGSKTKSKRGGNKFDRWNLED